MKNRIFDITFLACFFIAIVMTIIIFLAVRSGPSVVVRDVTIQEIDPDKLPPKSRASGISDKRPQIKLSEARPIINGLVEDISKDAVEHGLRESSPEEKRQLAESILARMKAQGTYDFVDQ